MAAKINAKASELREFARRFAAGENISSIAREMDRPRPTINGWRDALSSGKLVVEGDRVSWDGLDVDTGGKSSATNQKKELRELRAEVKRLQAQRELDIQALEEARKPRAEFKPFRAPTKKNSYKRLFVTDSHGEKVDLKAFGALLNDIERTDRILEFIIGGDMLDCDGFLSTHVPQYLAHFEYSYEDDIAAANDQLDQLQKRCPKAKFYYLEGNHEHRVERWISKQVINNQKDAEFMYRKMGPAAVLNLEKRGIEFIRQGGQYMGLKTRGTIKLGHCHFQHGTGTSSKTASLKNLQKFAACVVHGHNHSMQQASSAFMDGEPVMAACPGCLCQMHPMYNHSDPCTWTHGYGLQVANQDGTFHHINVPLNDGRSFLADLN